MTDTPVVPVKKEQVQIKQRRKRSISRKLSLWFFLVAMPPMLLVASISYYQANKSLKEAAINELEQTASLHVHFIQSWFNDRYRDISNQAGMKSHQALLSSLIEGLQAHEGDLKNFVGGNDWLQRIKGKQSDLNAIIDNYDYIYDIFLIDSKGNILFTIERESDLATNVFDGPYAGTNFSKLVIDSLQQQKILFSDIERYVPSNKVLSAFISAPLLSDGLQPLGAFVVQIRLNRLMDALKQFRSSNDLHYLVGKDGLLRTSKDGSGDDILTDSIQTRPFVEWIKGHEKSPLLDIAHYQPEDAVEYSGSEGETLIGVHNSVRIFNLDWVLISEVDKSLALASAAWLGKTIIVLVVLTGLLVGLFAFYQSRRITRPIENLEKATIAFAAGENEQFVEISSDDEIGRLAQAFNHMQEMRQIQGRELEESNQELKIAHEASKQAFTELKKQQSQLLIARDDAESAVRAKSEFLASMSHEIRTPMNGVLGMMSLLLNSRLNKEQHHQVSLARSSAISLLAVINDILDFSKIEAGKLEIESVDFDLRSLLGEFSEGIIHQSGVSDVELVVDVTDVEYSQVKGDPGRVRQVLSNLVGNALKFTSKGEVVVTVRLEEKGAEQLRLICSVADTGMGIPQTKIENLFESFTQADSSTTRKYGGSGLGLAIVKRLCEMMGGDIQVQSTEGLGSCFEFDLLLEKSLHSQRVVPDVDISQEPILVVDDNAAHRKVLQKQLSRWGALVTAAENAENALLAMTNKLEDDQQPFFTVVFIDQEMADVNGLELAKTIRSDARFESTQLVMMTSMGDRGNARFFAERGFCDYFPKPTTTADLFEAFALSIKKNNASGANSEKTFSAHQASNDELKQKEMPEKFDWPQNTRLLMVEDNLVNQTVAIALLDMIGLSSDVVENGQAALEALNTAAESDPYDLVLMDCQMPIMDGYDATRHIRAGKGGEVHRDVAIIALTANAMKGDKEKCLEAGMDDYISKPIDTVSLQSSLYHWLVTVKSESIGSKIPSLSAISRRDSEESQSLQRDSDASGKVKHSATRLIDSAADDSNIVIWDFDSALKRMLGKAKIVTVLVQTFLADTPQYIDSLIRHLEQGDLPAAAHSAHAVKGVAANLSALALANLAADLERCCLDKSTDDIDVLKVKIRPYFDKTIYMFQKYLNDNAQAEHHTN